MLHPSCLHTLTNPYPHSLFATTAASCTSATANFPAGPRCCMPTIPGRSSQAAREVKVRPAPTVIRRRKEETRAGVARSSTDPTTVAVSTRAPARKSHPVVHAVWPCRLLLRISRLLRGGCFLSCFDW